MQNAPALLCLYRYFESFPRESGMVLWGYGFTFFGRFDIIVIKVKKGMEQ